MDSFDDLFGSDEPTVEEKIEIPEAFQPTGIDIYLDSEHYSFAPDNPLFSKAKDVVAAREAEAAVKMQIIEARTARNEISAKIEDLRAEFSRKLQELEAEKAPFASVIWEIEKAERAAQRETKSAEQALRDAMLAERNKKAFQDQSIKFDSVTAGFSWREFALQHQIDGAKFLSIAKRGILADKMGLGKTLTSLIWADMLEIQKLLVIVPDDVASNFVNEIAHWAPHRTVIRVGKRNKAERDMIFNLLLPRAAEYTVVINYSAWRKDKTILEKLADCRFEGVIMDEAHSIKNIRSAAFKGCRDIVMAENSCPNCRGRIQPVHDATAERQDFMVCVGENNVIPSRMEIEKVDLTKSCLWSQNADRINGIKRDFGYLRSVENIITMTGTPILNKPTDIFAMLTLIDPVQYRSETDFIQNYCYRGYDNKITFRPGGMESLVKRLSGIYIGRDRKTAGVVLPKQEVQIHELEFDTQKYRDQHRVMRQLADQAMIMLSNGETLPIPAIIALITRQRQAVTWPAGIEVRDPDTGLVVFSVSDDVDESMKIDYIIERPQTSETGDWEGLGYEVTGEGDRINGERLVIFSQFKTSLRELEKRFKAAGVSVVRFDGDTPQDIRDQVKIDFDRKYTGDEDYKWQVVLCNYKTGGVGLNFTCATQMIILDEEWNPGKRDQAYARMDRVGQTEETTVHVIRQQGSIDNWLAGLIQNKEDMINDFESGASMQAAFMDFLKGVE